MFGSPTLIERPTIDYYLSDPDIDDILGVGVTAQIEIWRNGNPTPVVVTSGLVDPATGRGYFVVTSTQAPVLDTYYWRVRGYDISANVYGAWSPTQVFTLALGPTVTMVSPTVNATVATSTPQYEFSVVDGPMTRWRIQVYRIGAELPFYSTEEIATAPATSKTFVQPAGWLKNNTVYEVVATAWTAGGLQSSSAKRPFTVSYVGAPELGGIQASLLQYARDLEPTSVQVSWLRTASPLSQFEGYVIWRRTSNQDPTQAIPIAHIKQPGQLSYIDHSAPVNESLVYGVSQLQKVGPDTRDSLLVEIEIDVPLETPVITSALNGREYRVTTKNLQEALDFGFDRQDGSIQTWGSEGKKVLQRSPEGYGAESLTIGFTIKGDERGTLREHFLDVRNLVQSGHPLCVRYEMGMGFFKWVPGRYARRGASVGTYEITLQLEEIFYNEAAALDL